MLFLGVAESTDYCKCFGWGLPGRGQEDPGGTRGIGPPVLNWRFHIFSSLLNLTKLVLQCIAENRRDTRSLYIYIYIIRRALQHC